MNRAIAAEAHKLYAAISETAELMARRMSHGSSMDMDFRVSSQSSPGASWVTMADMGALRGHGLIQEVAVFTLKRLNEERQKKINEWGRRLAQLGFEKPAVCQ